VITLYKFGPFLGTPDSSPFVIKAMLLLRLAGVPFREAQGNPFKAPQRLLPYIDDDGVKVADSTLIRFHLEKKYDVDFDGGLDEQQRAVAWAVERMCEDHLYFGMLEMRWLDADNFRVGLGRHMFDPIPAAVRPIVKSVLRRMNAKRLHGHGIGRHPRQQIAELAIRDVETLAAILGSKLFLMGDKPCAADAVVFGIVTSILTPSLKSPIRAAMERRANLVSYRDRITNQYFLGPSLAQANPAKSSPLRPAALSG
jgi:glutathione S-transferase